MAGAARRVVLLPPELGETIAPAAQEQLRTSLRRGLASGLTDLELVPLEELLPALAAAAHGEACQQPACLRAVGAAVKAWVVVTAVASETLGTYTASLAAHTLQPEGILVEKTGACEICTLDEAVAEVTATARTLGEELSSKAVASPPPAPEKLQVSVLTHPAGARLLLDGAEAGTTPAVLQLLPGSYQFVVEKPGFYRSERELTLSASPSVVEFRLKPDLQAALPGRPSADVTPAAPVVAAGPPAEQRLGFDAFAYMGLGLGITSTAIGAVLLGLDGEPTCDGPLEECPTLWDTQAGGIAVTSVGAALLVGAAVLFLLDDEPPATSAASLSVRPVGLASPGMRPGLLSWHF
jgi:hypothetical protein